MLDGSEAHHLLGWPAEGEGVRKPVGKHGLDRACKGFDVAAESGVVVQCACKCKLQSAGSCDVVESLVSTKSLVACDF